MTDDSLEMLTKLRRQVTIGILMATLWSSPGSALADGIKIGGSGGALGVMKLLADEFGKTNRGTAVQVVPSLGSGGGIKALLGGALDIAVSARPVNDAEQRRGAVQRELGRTPFVFGVAAASARSGITLQEVRDIFAGTRTAWQDGSRIRLVLRPTTESDTNIVKGISPALAEAVDAAHRREGMLFAVTDQDTAETIEKIPGAFGTITLSQIITEQRPITALALDGVVPSVAAIKSGAYPHTKTYYIITNSSPGAGARQFTQFVFSDRGRKILERSGFWTVSEQVK